jgi:hypothetical protein
MYQVSHCQWRVWRFSSCDMIMCLVDLDEPRTSRMYGADTCLFIARLHICLLGWRKSSWWHESHDELLADWRSWSSISLDCVTVTIIAICSGESGDSGLEWSWHPYRAIQQYKPADTKGGPRKVYTPPTNQRMHITARHRPTPIIQEGLGTLRPVWSNRKQQKPTL